MPSLDAAHALSLGGVLDLVAVVTQPDRRGDRGATAIPAVKRRAQDHGIPVLQPARLRGEEMAAVVALRPDLLVWAAYGNLVPRSLLDAASRGAVNVHASLLPRWRGAAPIAHAILAGDAETGVTLMGGTSDLDAGPILAAEGVAIGADEDAGALTARLGDLGGRLLFRMLPDYLGGTLRGEPQEPRLVTWAPKLTSADGALDFAKPADELARRIRAFTPDPGAFTTRAGQRIGITRAAVTGGAPAEPGVLRLRDGVPHVAAGAGWLRLDRVRAAGKREMSGAEWARGVRSVEGTILPS